MKLFLIIMALMFSSPAFAQVDGLVGKTYNDVIKGSSFDPAHHAVSDRSKQLFTDTLNGPQTRGIVIDVVGRELLIYETCTAHLCAYQHSVIAIDVHDGSLYSAVYGDEGTTVVVPNLEIQGLLGQSCSFNRCDFTDLVKDGYGIEPLSFGDLKGFSGGANCRAFDTSGRVVLYTEGSAIIRYKGQRRLLREEGIGTDTLYSTDHEPSMVVRLIPREGRKIISGEASFNPLTMVIISDKRTIEYPVLMKCES